MIRELGSRIYYEKSTGNIIFTRGDMYGFVEESSIDEDFNMYTELQRYKREAVGVIELEYGKLNELLESNRANTYKVDVSESEHKLVFEYIDYETKKPIEPPKTIEEIIEEKIKEAKIENALGIAELSSKVEEIDIKNSTAVAEITEMLASISS